MAGLVKRQFTLVCLIFGVGAQQLSRSKIYENSRRGPNGLPRPVGPGGGNRAAGKADPPLPLFASGFIDTPNGESQFL